MVLFQLVLIQTYFLAVVCACVRACVAAKVMMAGRLIRVSSVSSALFASAGFYLYLRPPDLNDLSLVRFGRAAVTVSCRVFYSVSVCTSFPQFGGF